MLRAAESRICSGGWRSRIPPEHRSACPLVGGIRRAGAVVGVVLVRRWLPWQVSRWCRTSSGWRRRRGCCGSVARPPTSWPASSWPLPARPDCRWFGWAASCGCLDITWRCSPVVRSAGRSPPLTPRHPSRTRHSRLPLVASPAWRIRPADVAVLGLRALVPVVASPRRSRSDLQTGARRRRVGADAAGDDAVRVVGGRRRRRTTPATWPRRARSRACGRAVRPPGSACPVG